MLYKFKSKVTGDLIMLEANGRQMLTILGKSDTANLTQGVLVPGDMPAATAALVQAVKHDDEARATTHAMASQGDDTVEPLSTVSLRQRAAPLLEMIQRCQAENAPIVWGV